MVMYNSDSASDSVAVCKTPQNKPCKKQQKKKTTTTNKQTKNMHHAHALQTETTNSYFESLPFQRRKRTATHNVVDLRQFLISLEGDPDVGSSWRQGGVSRSP
jgi:hypothetical protein